MAASRIVGFRAGCILAVSAVLLSACAAHSAGSDPSWQPKPSFSGEGFDPVQSAPAQGQQPAPGSSVPSAPSASTKAPTDPDVVATKLTSPTGIAVLPDNTALVGERTTGRIVRVQPEPGQPVTTVRTIPRLSTAGGGGLLDLAISPNYGEDNLIFAYVTTRTDNRVVAFTLAGPITTVLKGIPRGSSDNTGRLAFAADGSLLIGTGDAGHPSLASDPASLAGKILRISDIGKPAAGNPRPNSPVYASGLRRTDGLCLNSSATVAAASTPIFQTESLDGSSPDPINRVVAGASYGWPSTNAPTQRPLATLPVTAQTPGGCAVLNNVLYTTSLDGKELLAATVRSGTASAVTLGSFAPTLHNTYGRLHTVVAAADGALWLTTANRDGHGKPVADDERVIRIVPSGGGTGGDTR